ncbi:MAG: sensor histidine kinase [Clostridium sp.]|uniref:sensor histidine kinase n=1 Tax=Clostridium sp. TaxID=1506 RepID=UPI0030203ACB
MRISEFIKERIVFLIFNIVIFTAIAGVMAFLKFGFAIIFVVAFIWFMPILSYMIIEYSKFNKFFSEVNSLSESLDRRYLMAEIVEEPEFLEGKLFYDLLKDTNRDMHENIKSYSDMQTEYREYIETWVHEIKTPIASSKLIIENNKNEVTSKINLELKRVEEYIEQALYYSRSNDVSKDYIIKKFSLETAVRNTIKRNSSDFIYKGIQLEIKDIEADIYSDIKWVEFILNQVIGNAIKYSNSNKPKVEITSVKNPNNIILTIKDNGVGIDEKDIRRVFEKGFTGENGRVYGKSTGIGLYLCKKLCEKLGVGISISSAKGEGTKVSLIFPLGKHNLLY